MKTTRLHSSASRWSRMGGFLSVGSYYVCAIKDKVGETVWWIRLESFLQTNLTKRREEQKMFPHEAQRFTWAPVSLLAENTSPTTCSRALTTCSRSLTQCVCLCVLFFSDAIDFNCCGFYLALCTDTVIKNLLCGQEGWLVQCVCVCVLAWLILCPSLFLRLLPSRTIVPAEYFRCQLIKSWFLWPFRFLIGFLSAAGFTSLNKNELLQRENPSQLVVLNQH